MVDCSCTKVEGGPLGCTVLFAAFMIQVVALGTMKSIGIYNIEFLRHFDTGAAAVSLVGSINLGILLGAGPLASFLMSKWGHRRVALFGAALSSFGWICTSFSPSIPYMYIFFGVITGMIIDQLGNMDAAFYFAGGITIAGGLVMCIVPIHRRVHHTLPHHQNGTDHIPTLKKAME